MGDYGEGWGLWQTGQQTMQMEPLLSAPATCQTGTWPNMTRFSDFSGEASKQDFDVKTNF